MTPPASSRIQRSDVDTGADPGEGERAIARGFVFRPSLHRLGRLRPWTRRAAGTASTGLRTRCRSLPLTRRQRAGPHLPCRQRAERRGVLPAITNVDGPTPVHLDASRDQPVQANAASTTSHVDSAVSPRAGRADARLGAVQVHFDRERRRRLGDGPRWSSSCCHATKSKMPIPRCRPRCRDAPGRSPPRASPRTPG